MKADVLSHFPMTWLTCVALLIFFGVFTAIVFRTFKKSNHEHYLHMEQLPLLKEGNRHE